MRHNLRKHREAEEEESVFVSMTDMTVSFLFIVILLLAYFASHFSGAGETVPKAVYETVIETNTALTSQIAAREGEVILLNKKIADLEAMIAQLKKVDLLEAYLSKSADARYSILATVRKRLKIDFPDLMIEISAESDALRFQGEGLFGRGESQLAPDKRKIVDAIAMRLDELLPVYTLGNTSAKDLKSILNSNAAIIEAVQIEGHTDSDGDDVLNLRLSTDRANATFLAMLQAAPNLTSHLNYKMQPVLSIAGYGRMRPVVHNDTPQGKATNRRIDLRIIMHTPRNIEEVEIIKRKLKEGY